jgi:hypothetical protein
MPRRRALPKTSTTRAQSQQMRDKPVALSPIAPLRKARWHQTPLAPAHRATLCPRPRAGMLPPDPCGSKRLSQPRLMALGQARRRSGPAQNSCGPCLGHQRITFCTWGKIVGVMRNSWPTMQTATAIGGRGNCKPYFPFSACCRPGGNAARPSLLGKHRGGSSGQRGPAGKRKGNRFETLAAICEVLECQPGDLMEAAISP